MLSLQGRTEGRQLFCRNCADTVPKFRPHLPAGCPPPEAEPANGETFYRLVLADQLDDRAFLSLAEEGKACLDSGQACQWAGVSLCRSRHDIDAPRKISPKKFGNARIARGALTQEFGVVKPTPRAKIQSHATYWPYDTAEPWLVFQIVDEQNDDG